MTTPIAELARVIVDIVDEAPEHEKVDTFLALVYHVTGSPKMTSITENSIIMQGLPEVLKAWKNASA